RIGMQRGIVLHLAAFADLDPLVVAAQDRAEPDAGMAPEPNAADDSRGFRDPIAAVGGQVGLFTIQLIERHSGISQHVREEPCHAGEQLARLGAPACRHVSSSPTVSMSMSISAFDIMPQKPADMVARITNLKRRPRIRLARKVLRMTMRVRLSRIARAV